MEPVQLFDLASRQARWLSVRQAVIAGNVANANTAGFRPLDVEDFATVLSKSTPSMVATNARHLGGENPASAVGLSERDSDVPVRPSGNSVRLEDELVKAGEIRRDFELNTAIVKAFHRMILMAART
ncbi:MAG TPA: flagellar basal body rod protein FlgB [Rhizobiales bacterium]|nr:flagellar basal body rod protein FlgB [Hyphomicrobiales bacterium]